MRRFAAVLSLFVFSVSFAILILPHAAACPVAPPVPLRGLYLKSDVVVVARVGTPGKWKVSPAEGETSERYQVYRRSVPLRVEETIKGGEVKNLAVTEDRWKWLGNADDSKVVLPNAVQEPDTEFDSDLADNKDRRLFFLTKNEESEGYSEVYRNHAFAPTQKELDIYITRLRELGNIYNAAPPSKELIVEWLVSMAEDPVTRFEGAYELREALESARAASDEEEEESKETAEAEPAAKSDSAEAASAETSEKDQAADEPTSAENLPLSPLVYNDYGGDQDFAKLLTADQKERLIRAFLNVRFNYEAVKDEDVDEDKGYVEVLNDADAELLGAVSNLDDRRVIDRLLAELPSVARYQTWQTSEMMETLSAYFDDDKLSELVEKYCAINWGSDDDFITEQDKAYDKPEAVEAVESGTGTVNLDRAAAVSPEPDAAKENSRDSEPKAALPLKTYRQRRAELLDRIMARCGYLIASGKKL
jgi:hypothetical protein